jgi:hypothetical protein
MRIVSAIVSIVKAYLNFLDVDFNFVHGFSTRPLPWTLKCGLGKSNLYRMPESRMDHN